MQLPEKPNDLLLGRGSITELLIGELPDFIHRALAVHQPNEVVGGGTETMELPRGWILEHMPEPFPVVVAMYPGVSAQARLQSGNAVP
jgi:hypothetical protein